MAKKILVVDDSESLRMVVQFVLAKEGYEITTAVDGVDALSKLPSDNFNLIITDLHMPNMDGLELIKQVRKFDEYKYLPILLSTSEDQMSAMQQANKAGITGWIVKPFQPEKLVRAVRKVLR